MSARGSHGAERASDANMGDPAELDIAASYADGMTTSPWPIAEPDSICAYTFAAAGGIAATVKDQATDASAMRVLCNHCPTFYIFWMQAVGEGELRAERQALLAAVFGSPAPTAERSRGAKIRHLEYGNASVLGGAQRV